MSEQLRAALRQIRDAKPQPPVNSLVLGEHDAAFAARLQEFARAALAAAPTPEPKDCTVAHLARSARSEKISPEDLAIAMNSAQIKATEIALGHDLVPVAKRILEHLNPSKTDLEFDGTPEYEPSRDRPQGNLPWEIRKEHHARIIGRKPKCVCGNSWPCNELSAHRRLTNTVRAKFLKRVYNHFDEETAWKIERMLDWAQEE